MATVQDILSDKGAKVHTVAPQATVMDAVSRMNQHKIGALVVMDRGQVVGMFTERDVLQRVLGQGRSPSEMIVAEVMTRDVVCCDRRAELDDISTLMKNRRIRHVPVCEAGQLIGLVSIGDLNAYHASHQEATIHFLNDYIYGRA